MKKTLALILAAIMALSLVACAKTPANGGTEAKGSVYYLNFKPEADQAWQALAKTYTEKTGVEVKVVTAASGQYDTMLTSDGANLSQGQRQLLAIARAAVSEAPVLILDEATSSVDTRTEKLIERGLDGLMKGRTVFVIAHRLSTVRNADAILVLENGRVVERGNHNDLLELRGRYYQLYTNMIELA